MVVKRLVEASTNLPRPNSSALELWNQSRHFGPVDENDWAAQLKNLADPKRAQAAVYRDCFDCLAAR